MTQGVTANRTSARTAARDPDEDAPATSADPTASKRPAPFQDAFRGPNHPEQMQRAAERRTLGDAPSSVASAAKVAPARSQAQGAPFNREAMARAIVDHSNGTIREVPTPFPGSTLFEPTSPSKGAAVLILHGSEGGNQPFSMFQAAELAKHGYAALAFSYFDVPGSSLPKQLLDVPLERTQSAADWLRARYGRVGLDGVSRGGEQAMKLASLDATKTRFDAVAGEVPSSQVWGAWDPKKMDTIRDRRGNVRAAWTLDGKPLQEGQPIPIEKYPGPIFLTGSGKDSVWPSSDFVRQLEQRLEAHGRKAEVHIFPNEDHILSPNAWAEKSKMLLDFFDRTLAR
jgi:dienelactone hydrolase